MSPSRKTLVALLVSALCSTATPGAAPPRKLTDSHPPVALGMNGVWLPDSRHSERLPRTWPLTPAAQAAADGWQQKYGPVDPTVDDVNASCIAEPHPYSMRLIAQYPFEILFTPGRMTLFHEVYGSIRRVNFDARAHTEDPLPTVMGHSLGHWEGETLVVETTHVRRDGAGLPTGNPPVGSGRRFTERFTLGTDDQGKKELRNEIRIEDPGVLAEPVVVKMRYKWSPGIEVGEYLCQQDIWDQNVQGSPSSVPWRQ
jgi:hypothetical protein